MNFFFSWILTLDLPLCQKCQEKIRRSNIFIFKDQHKGDDEWIKDFRNGCCGNVIFNSLGVLIWVCNVVILRREYLLNSGSFGDLGTRGCSEVYKVTLPYFILNLCVVSERNHMMMSKLYLWDFCCWCMSYHSH